MSGVSDPARVSRLSHALGRALWRLSSGSLSGLIRGYQLGISPMLPPSCRYWPTCSAYALQAIERHGPWQGAWLAAGRLCRCHPWGRGGLDPVPEQVRRPSFFR